MFNFVYFATVLCFYYCKSFILGVEPLKLPLNTPILHPDLTFSLVLARV